VSHGGGLVEAITCSEPATTASTVTKKIGLDCMLCVKGNTLKVCNDRGKGDEFIQVM
jgi:hypothetical protein